MELPSRMTSGSSADNGRASRFNARPHVWRDDGIRQRRVQTCGGVSRAFDSGRKGAEIRFLFSNHALNEFLNRGGLQEDRDWRGCAAGSGERRRVRQPASETVPTEPAIQRPVQAARKPERWMQPRSQGTWGNGKEAPLAAASPAAQSATRSLPQPWRNDACHDAGSRQAGSIHRPPGAAPTGAPARREES